MNDKDRKNLLLAAGGTGVVAGAALYENLPDRLKYVKQVRDIKPLSRGDKILLVASDPKFGSGHRIQAEAVLKELRNRGYNAELVNIQDLDPKYNKAGKEILYDLYSKKINDVSFNRQWADSYYFSQRSAAKELAKNLKNYDRVLFFTGDASEALARPFSKLRRAVLKKDAPFTHLVFTDRGVHPYNAWWNKANVDSARPTATFYDSIIIPDETSYKRHLNEKYISGKVNPRFVTGLAVDLDQIEVPKNALNPRYFVHGGSTGINVLNTTERLLEYFKEGKGKGDALIVFGRHNTNKEKLSKLKEAINQYNASTGGPKIYFTDALPKPEMNYYLQKSLINFGAGGTTYEELGKLGKPSLFTYTPKKKVYSHPVPIIGTNEAVDKYFTDYIEMKKPLSEIPGTEKGIARLTGSEMVDVSNPENFKKRLLEFEDTLESRKEIAAKNKNLFGSGAAGVVNLLEEGDRTVKYKYRMLPKSLLTGLAALGGGVATKSVIDLIDKPKKSDSTKEKVLKGGLVGLGALLAAAVARNKDIARLYRDTNKFRQYNPDTPLFRIIDELKSLYRQGKSPLARVYKKMG